MECARLRCFRLFAPSLPLLLLGGAAVLHAQTSSTGALGGVVRDPAGASIAGVQVQLECVTTSFHQTLRSDRLGEFLFVDLAPGSYRIRVDATGFDDLRVAATEVQLGRTTRIAPLLRLGAVAQTVSVQALDDMPPFDAPVNANLSPRELQTLPLDGRRFQSLALLTPLVDADDAAPADPADSNGADDAGSAAPDTDNVRLTVRGLDPKHNQYTLDGLSLTRAFDGEPRGGRTLPFTVAQEGVQEFQVRAVGEGTARGRDAGGSVNTVSRRGEDAVHGSGFFLLRDSGVGAANPFAISTRYNNGSPTSTLVKPRDLREQFGGWVGGPLLRGSQGTRVFGFVAAEGQRRTFPGVRRPAIPTSTSCPRSKRRCWPTVASMRRRRQGR